MHLLRLPTLKKVYLYNTVVSDIIVDVLGRHLPDAKILKLERPSY